MEVDDESKAKTESILNKMDNFMTNFNIISIKTLIDKYNKENASMASKEIEKIISYNMDLIPKDKQDNYFK